MRSVCWLAVITSLWTCTRAEGIEALSLLQVSSNFVGALQTGCTPLDNRGTYFSLEVGVGSPPQKFDVVADTGSDAVIIPSCICQTAGRCDKKDKCFSGTNHSSTFLIQTEVPMVSMEFGSGTITSALATDVVSVGSVNGTMQDGLLLMVDRQLDIRGAFEGILGLGQLQQEYRGGQKSDSEDQADWDKPSSSASGEQGSLVKKAVKKVKHVKAGEARPEGGFEIPGFLRTANVDRFSICFNDGNQPGVLRLNSPDMQRKVPSVGTMHWGMDFAGMSVGSSKLPALFCDGTDRENCGAIPDSGTTLMMGPEDQLRVLFAGICDQWPRCKKAHEKGPFKGRPKEEVFQRVLLKCESWLDDEKGQGLDELPSIYLHLPSPTGKQHIELSPWSWIFEAVSSEVGDNMRLLGNVGLSEFGEENNSSSYGCTPAFGASQLSSGSAEEVWIIGTPLFYDYVVNYDLSAQPPSMAFSSEPCGNCERKTVLLAEKGGARYNVAARKRPRRMGGPPRIGRSHRKWSRVKKHRQGNHSRAAK